MSSSSVRYGRTWPTGEQQNTGACNTILLLIDMATVLVLHARGDRCNCDVNNVDYA